jgi:hypothetical protein
MQRHITPAEYQRCIFTMPWLIFETVILAGFLAGDYMGE